MSDASSKIVHALDQGQPLCGFTSEIPRYWPSRHTWTQIENVSDITCAGCLTKAVTIEKARATTPS